jgi:arginyl-tRNA synthetase
MSYSGTPQPAPPFTAKYPHIEGTNPSRAPLDIFRTAVAVQVNRAIPELKLEKIFDGVEILKKEGDFSVAMPRFRLGGKPDDWATKVVQSFQRDECIESVKQVGPFLYFVAEPEMFARVVLSTIERETYHTTSGKPEYGSNDSGKGKSVLIEYSAPNIAKHFHIGHLRSTIIGQCLINLYKANGWTTIATNYLGDWGKQVERRAVITATS